MGYGGSTWPSYWGLVGLYLLLLPFRFKTDLPFHVSLSDAVLGLCILLLAPTVVRKVKWGLWHFAIAFSIVYGLFIAVVQEGSVSLYALFNRAVGAVVLFLIYAMICAVVRSWSDVTFVLRTMCIGVSLQNSVAIAEFVVSWLLQRDLVPWLNSYDRLEGLYGDPNAYGGLLVVVIMILLATTRTPASLFRQSAEVLQLVTLGAGLLLTFSRSAWLAYFAGLFILALYRPVFVCKVCLSVVVTLSVLFGGSYGFSTRMVALATRGEQVQQRLEILERAANLIVEYSFTGMGLGEYYERFGVLVHNTMMWWLVECGLFGLIAFAVFAWSNAARCRRVIRYLDSEQRYVVVGLLAAHTAMLGLSVGIEAFYQRQWWVILGLIASVDYHVVRGQPTRFGGAGAVRAAAGRLG